jgi:hypothetical protein
MRRGSVLLFGWKMFTDKNIKREREKVIERERENGSMDFAFVEKEEKEEQKSV